MEDTKSFHIAKLIEKYLIETASLEEEAELIEWINENAEHKKILDSYKNSTAIQKELILFSSFKPDKAWVEFRRKHRLKSSFKWVKYVAAVAAVFFIFSIPFLHSFFNNVFPDESLNEVTVEETREIGKPGGEKAVLLLSDGTKINLEDQQTNLKEKDGTHINDRNGELIYENLEDGSGVSIYNELKVPKGGIYRLSLSDGTKVWLNSMSSIRFPVHFSQKERKIYLEGEAYFEVAHNKDAPFIVELNGRRVEVLGTSFNVNDYDEITKTTLIEGAVKVWNKDGFKLLKPGQVATVGESIKIEKTNIEKAMAWQKGEFYFMRDSMEDIMLQLERWYNVEVEVVNENSKTTKVSGRIKRDVPLNEVIELLEFASKVKFDLNGNVLKVII